MKKHFALLLTALLLAGLLGGCAANESMQGGAASEAKEAETQAVQSSPQDKAKPEESADGQAQSESGYVAGYKPLDPLTISEPKSAAERQAETEADLIGRFDSAEKIAFDTDYPADKNTIRLTSCYWAEEIIPDQPKSVAYQYIDAKDDSCILAFRGVFQNGTGNELVSNYTANFADNYLTLCKYGEEYYWGGIVFATEENDSITSRVPAGAEVSFYVLFDIPNELQQEGASASLLLGLGNFSDTICSFTAGMRIDWDKCAHLYRIDAENISTKA